MIKHKLNINTTTYNLYPEISPYQTAHYASLSLHRIYYEVCGNPDGYPVVFLHGGPGSGCHPNQRRFFDPSFYRIILIDQRGCGRSEPQGCIESNTTQDLLDDIEAIRQHLGIDKWLVFGGSWGSTLALAYATAHTAHVSGLVLRGIFLSRPQELRWFLQEAQQFFPETWQTLLAHIPADERHDVLQAYAKRVFSEDTAINATAARNWNAYEGSIMSLMPSSASSSATDAVELARARVQIHYILHQCFVDGDDLLQKANLLQHIPTAIVQGRYDMVCPPITAWELKQALPDANFIMVPDAGHSAMEPGVCSALIAATEAFKAILDKI